MRLAAGCDKEDLWMVNPRYAPRPSPGSLRRDRLPPLAPPRVTHQYPQLWVPAVGDGVFGVEVVAAVVALLVAVRLALQGGSLHEIPELEPVLLIDGLGLRVGDLVLGQGAKK